MELTTKINNNKILAANLGNDILISFRSFKIKLPELNAIIKTYLSLIYNTSIDIDVSELNRITKIKLFGTELSVNDAFSIYNEIIKEFKPKGYEVVSKNVYDPNNSINFSPS